MRFASRFDLKIEAGTRAAIEAMAPQVRQVSAERIAKELRGMLESPSRARAMKLAEETGLLGAVLPELAGWKMRFGDRLMTCNRICGITR